MSFLTVAVLVMVKEIVFLVVRFINFNFVNAFSTVVFIVVSGRAVCLGLFSE